jgi:hypothetical protein
MKPETFLATLASVRYHAGWEFSGEAGDGVGIVHIDALVPRAKHGGLFRFQWSSEWVPLPGLRLSKLERIIRDTIDKAETHEREERLRINGRRPFNPHGDA